MAESPEPLDFLDLDHLLTDEERAVRDTVRDVVSGTSERLVRDEIDRIRQQAEGE